MTRNRPGTVSESGGRWWLRKPKQDSVGFMCRPASPWVYKSNYSLQVADPPQHNVLDGYFGKLSQSTKGGVGGRQSLGSGSLSQQDWDKTAENTLKNVDVKVVNTRALYDYVGHYKDCLDPKFTGFGPGTPMRVMQLFLGDATEMFPKGEPLLRYMYMYDNPYYSRVYCDIFRYKLAAQYSYWYPDDPRLE